MRYCETWFALIFLLINFLVCIRKLHTIYYAVRLWLFIFFGHGESVLERGGTLM